MLKNSISCLLLGLLLLPAARAEIVPGFYQQSVLVTDQSSSERRRAISSALEKMIVRASGSANAMLRVTSGQLTSNPDSSIEAYRYESTDQVVERDGRALPASRLILNFSKSAVERVLRAANLPIWSSNRPSVLIWLVRDDVVSGRQLVSLQHDSDVAAAVRSVAAGRGLPIIVPLLDLEDRLNINPDQLWSLDEAAIIEASARYQADVVVVARYSQTSSGKWLATWSLGHKDKREIFDVEVDSETAAMERGIGVVTDYLASWYAIQPGAQSGGYLSVELQRVQQFSDYVKALAYLGAMDIVREVNLVSIDQDRVSMKLIVEGDIQSLLDALALDRKLIPVPAPVGAAGYRVETFPAGSETDPLRFIWSR